MKHYSEKNILISYPGFNIDKIKTLKDKGSLLILGLRDIKSVFFKKTEKLIAGTWNLDDKQFKFFLEIVFCFSRAKNKYFIDNQGRQERFSFFKFIFLDTPLFILEITFDLLLIIFSWLTLFIFHLFPERRLLRHSVPRNDDDTIAYNDQKIIYLRTDNFRGLQQGGSFTHFRGVIKGFYKLGFQIHYIGSGLIEVPNLNFPHSIIPYCLKFNLLEVPEIYYNWRFIPKALKIIQKEKPLFIYQRHSIFNACGAILSLLTNIPLILEYNGSEPWVRQKWGGLLIFKRLCYFMENFSLKKADLIIVVSQPLKEELIKRGIPEKRILVNYNGVDTEEFNPNIDGLEIRKKLNLENKIIIGAVSTFGAWHGMPILAQAIHLIINRIQNTRLRGQAKYPPARAGKIHFLFIGDGVQRSECELIIKESGMEDYVTFIGIVSYKEIPKYLAACDILVSSHIPNTDGTSFFGSPTKLFEYMAMGKGIVASDLDQIGEVLKDKKTALLVKPGDVNDLSNGIIQLINNKNLRDNLGKNAREEVIKNYTWESNVERMMDKYEEIY